MDKELSISVRGLYKDFYSLRPVSFFLEQDPRKYQADTSKLTKVLKGIDLDIRKGVSVGLLGRNASGKTTLLKIIAGIQQPTKGSCERSGRVAYCPGKISWYYDNVSLMDNLYAYGAILGLGRGRIRHLFETSEVFRFLWPFVASYPYECSDGVLLRAVLSLIMNSDADVLIMDEGPLFVDHDFQDAILKFFMRWVADGKTLILSSHNNDVIEKVCPQTILLDQGVVQGFGDTHKIIKRYTQEA